MSAFNVIARRAVVEASLDRYGITPEYVFETWLKGRYREVINGVALGDINRVSNAAFVTTAQITAGTVSVTNGSAAVVGVGTNFIGLAGYAFRIAGVRGWYSIASVADAENLTLDTAFADTTRSDVAYFIAQRFYNLPTDMRWMVDAMLLGRQGGLAVISKEKLDEIAPDRIAAPGLPQYIAPVGWNQSTSRRIVELYPAAVETHRVEVTGFAHIDEPTYTGSPIVDIRDEVLIEGTLADAFRFRAGRAAEEVSNVTSESLSLGTRAIVQSRALLEIANSHEGRFALLKEQLAIRDNRDAKQKRIQLVIQREPAFGSVYDPLKTAHDEIYYRSPF